MASVFLLNGMVSQYRASLNRDLRFEALVLSDVSGPVWAWHRPSAWRWRGWGVWALVAQQVIGVLVTTVVAVSCSRWLPRLPNRRGDIRGMLRFGLGMFGTQVIGYFNLYVDTLTIGLRLGTAELGIYDRAYQVLMRTLNQFRNPTMSVGLPILSKMEPGSAEGDRMILRGQAALGYTFVAGTALAAGAAGPLIHLFLGPQWVAAVPDLRRARRRRGLPDDRLRELLDLRLPSTDVKAVPTTPASAWPSRRPSSSSAATGGSSVSRSATQPRRSSVCP